MPGSSATYIVAPRNGATLFEAAEATRAEAAKRLGADETSDELSIVGCHELDEDRLAVTWRRREPEAPQADEPAAAPSPPDA